MREWDALTKESPNAASLTALHVLCLISVIFLAFLLSGTVNPPAQHKATNN